MKQKLEENKGIPASLLWILAIISGLSVANLYYNQPLLNRISEDLGISEFTANLIPMTTQIGYALGLLFIIPLGDLYKRKNIIVINFLLLSVATCSIAMSVNVFYLSLYIIFSRGIEWKTPAIQTGMSSGKSLPQSQTGNDVFQISRHIQT
jgi:MFS family permease